MKGGGGGLLGPDSKQEHSWDMFKIGQTALHSKVDIYIALLTSETMAK